jgi:rod shape-determining protein MreC
LPKDGAAIKPIFTKGPSLNLRLLFGIVVSLGLLLAEQRDKLAAFRTALSNTVFPLQEMVHVPVEIAAGLLDTLASHTHLVEENRLLKDEQIGLKSKLLKFNSLEQENIRLRGLLETSFKLGEQVLIAEIMNVNLVPYEHVVVVNKGTRYGIYPSQPVMDANGIVGQVLRVNTYNAEVMLITDPNHAIPVQVMRNGLRTIALGTGQIDRLSLPYLTSKADIKPGDQLISSGMGGVFPYGYPVATVTSVETQISSFARISATPVAQLDRTRELLMVWSKSDPIPKIPEAADAAAKTHTAVPPQPHASK